MRSLCSQVQHVQRLHIFAVIGYASFMTQTMVSPGIMSADEALGMTLNQYLFSAGLSASSFAPNLGLSHSSVSRKLRGRVGWSLAEILSAASFFGIEPADLMPTPDGMGGWIPAPFKPARRRDVDALVPQVGLEPTTHERDLGVGLPSSRRAQRVTILVTDSRCRHHARQAGQSFHGL